jgi:hypothetical protein
MVIMPKRPEGMRAQAERRQKILDLLTDIRDLLKAPGAAPPPGSFPSLADLQRMIEAAMNNYGVLQRANNFYVKTIDLSTANSNPSELTDLENAMALTILTNTGTFNLILQVNDDNHKITINSLTWPQTLLIDWFDIKKVWITNTEQSGQNATIIKFFRS